MSGPIGRNEPVDVLTGEQGALLLYGERLVALSPLAAAAFELARDGITLATLAARLEEEFGAPDAGNPEEATAQVVARLVEQGVLTQEAG